MRHRVIVRWLAASVLLIVFGCSHSNTPSDGTNSATANGGSSTANQAASTPAPAPPVVIAAGTILTVTLDQNIGTKTNTGGDLFAASLAEPVTIDGNQVLPKGTKATGTVVQAQPAGRLKGGAILALSLDGISVQGQKYSITTSEFEQTIKGRSGRTAVGAGGGAAFGAIVGALAGGGKGAVIGGVAGGGAGTAGAAYTGKRDITLPAETRLHFKLKAPLSIPAQ